MRARPVAQGVLIALAGGLAIEPLAAQSRFRPPPAYVQFGEPDQAEGRALLAEFRRMGIAGDYALEFVLRVLPRRGREWQVAGRLLGSREGTDPVSRAEFAEGEPAALLIRAGDGGGVWTLARGATDARVLPEAEWFAPLAGTGLTAFDLQMPFLRWDDVVYEGLARLRGRPAHQFLAYPPPAVAEARPELAGVRFYLDTQFTALVQAEQIGPGGRTLRTVTVLELKRAADQWVVKTVDVRDEATRDKTRFRVTAAALNLLLAPVIFRPGHLGVAVPGLDEARFIPFP